MKLKISALLILFLLSNFINAQFGFGKLEDINKTEEVPLLVVLLNKNEKTIKKLAKKKDGSLEDYYKKIEDYNNSIKASFEKNWSFSKEVRFIKYNDLESYNSKDNKEKYAYFTRVINKGDNGFSLLKSKGLMTTFNYAIFITGKKKPVYNVMYSSDVPNEADFKFMTQQFQSYFKSRRELKSGKKSRKEMMVEMNSKAHLLKQKLLLIDKDNLHPKLEKSIQNLYKFPYKVTTKEEIDNSILNNSDVVYLKIVPIGQLSGSSGSIKASKLMHVQQIINAKNGELLAFVAPSGLGYGGPIGTIAKDGKARLKEKDLKKIIKTIEGKK